MPEPRKTPPIPQDLGTHHRSATFARALAATLALCTVSNAAIAQASSQPRFPAFFSLKSNPVNVRKGPGTQYPKVWIFRREGLPVEVLREHERWREVRDSDGATGWILRTLISRRRTALVSPWLLKEKQPAPALTLMRSGARDAARAVAKLEPGTLLGLKSCDRNWCEVSVGNFRGYVPQNALWGVYPGEVVR